jgi:hypothetical protein
MPHQVVYPRADWEIDAVQRRFEAVWGRDYYGGGSIFDIFGGSNVPPVISEVPETWEELESLEPELFEPILETRPGLPPDPYPFDPDVEPEREFLDPVTVVGAPEDWWPTTTQTDDTEETEMAHDWGHLAREFLGGLIGGESTGPVNGGTFPAGYGPSGQIAVTDPLGIASNGHSGDCDGMAWSGGTPPKGYKVVNSCGRGVLRKVRRRRRPRLLTASDSRDIATIVGLVGKGQMASALINRR